MALTNRAIDEMNGKAVPPLPPLPPPPPSPLAKAKDRERKVIRDGLREFLRNERAILCSFIENQAAECNAYQTAMRWGDAIKRIQAFHGFHDEASSEK